jgi:hypothetical protein
MRRVILVAACLFAIAVVPRGAERLLSVGTVSVQPSLSDLHSVDELRTLFNRDAGTVRLVLATAMFCGIRGCSMARAHRGTTRRPA